MSLLIADMRRKEEKRHAKRLANRKSASTSRARKKALIEEMTKDNARLRRQALILSYLPDPVIAISTDGVITFCSMQVERVLKHEVSGLVGANIEDIIVPNSRESIRRLIRDLIIAEQRALSVDDDEDESCEGNEDGNGNNRDDSNAAAMLHEISGHSSEQNYPPLLEVKVKAGQGSTEVAAGEDVSDSSGDPPSKNGQAKLSEMSSLTHKNSSLSPDSGEDQQPPSADKEVKTSEDDQKKASTTESDDSTSSAKKASANLSKNVKMCKLNKDKEGEEQVRFSHKDDVMGASVTANNADAKLSSLMHHPKKPKVDGDKSSAKKQPKEQVKKEEQSSSSAGSSSLSKTKKRSGNSSEDSGYRDSNESPEESNEYPEDSSSSSSGASSERSSSRKKKRRKRTRPLAPACNIRLIRNDLSTIWCELTSSIRTKPSNDVPVSEFDIKPKGGKDGNDSAASSESVQEEEKELLLCFRPIREGEVVGEELRFCPKVSESERTDGSDGPSSEDLKQSSKSSSGNSATAAGAITKATSSSSTQGAVAPPSPQTKKNRPPKKRKFDSKKEDHDATGVKKRRPSHDTLVDDQDEKSAVESMMELASSKV